MVSSKVKKVIERKEKEKEKEKEKGRKWLRMKYIERVKFRMGCIIFKSDGGSRTPSKGITRTRIP